MKKLLLLLTMLITCVGFSFAQRTITGKISDAKGEPLIGASVLVKGTTIGTVTDLDGNYSLNVPANAATLVASFAGYESKELAIGASNSMDVSLSDSVLGEVLVTGQSVGTDRRKTATDVQSVSAKNLPPVATSSIDQALVGKIAGAQISSVNGNPGQRVSILLRGINTINRGTQPMILVDGVEMGATDLNTVDLATIDHVEVVQGAASSALYGAQGANGVIQLFTKKGKEGIHVDFNTSYTIGSILNIGGLRKAALHGYVTNANNEVVDNASTGTLVAYDPTVGAFRTSPIWNSTDTSVITNKPYDKNLKYYDHYKTFFQNAATLNNSLSISGAGAKSDFLFAVSNNSSTSPFIGNGDYNRSNVVANLGIQLLPGLKFRTTTQLGYTVNTSIDPNGRNTFYAANNTRPFGDYTQTLPDGTYSIGLGSAVGPNGNNPFFVSEYKHQKAERIDIIQNFNLNYQPFKWLELDAKYGINYNISNTNARYDRQTENPNVAYLGSSWTNYGTDQGEIDQYARTTSLNNFITGATVRYGIADFIKASTYGGFDYRNRIFKAYDTYGLNLPTYSPATSAQTTEQHVATDYTEKFVTYGFIVDQKFDFGDYAGIGGGFRTDYSSAFGAGSTPFTFPHANGYLRLSELPFWKNSALINTIGDFKLRAAYGKAGIQPTAFQRQQTFNTNTIGGSVGFTLPDRLSNPDLQVEVSTETEVGADIGFKLGKGNWLNSLIISPTYWTRTTDNAIGSSDNAPSSGVASVVSNNISLGSHGFQTVLKLGIAETKNFTWNLTTNFGTQTSMVTKLTGAPIIATTAAGSTSYIIKEGDKIGQIYGYLGIHDVNAVDNTGAAFIADANKKFYEVASNGWVVDKRTKAPFFSSKLYSFGDPNPDFIMNFINSVTYKNFLTLNVQVDWIQGSHIYNQTKEWMYRDGIHSDYEIPITINGQNAAWSAFYRGVYAVGSRNGTKNYFYEDASFTRLRNVELAVDVVKLFDLKFAKSIIVSISGRNLITLTKYTGMDPEVNSSNAYGDTAGSGTASGGGFNSAWDRGTDHNTIPNLKQYTVGLKVGF